MKNFAEKISILKKINTSLTYFSIYLFRKNLNKKEEIYLKFIDRYYQYNNKKFIDTEVKLTNIKEFYIIYSEIPLALDN